MKKTLRFSACLLLVSSFAFAQNPKSWTKVNEQEIKIVKDAKGREFPQSSLFFRLDIASMREVLFSAPKSAAESNVIISIPNVDGKMEQYRVWENSNFAPELQAQFPDIRAYSGTGVNDKSAAISISVAPTGIQTMVLRAGKKSEFIEQYSADGKVYALFNSEGRQFGETPFNCSTQDDHELHNRLSDLGLNSTFSNNQSFKTFRLALSCTSEYTAYHGNTVAGALAGMNATMSRVNGVFAIDLAIKLELIANNASLIYTNAATDPYSDAAAGSGGAWNLELQNNLTATIGNAAYDLGHLFGASGGGGNAGCIGCVCVNPVNSSDEAKGSAFTSPANDIPAGDLFDIDYVAHEIGHQLGANHTFSHSNEINGVNVEPGGGTTIMAYAGITNYNIQANSDDYFTYRSILQIQNNLATKTCPTSVPMTNTPPTVNAGADYTIPKSTPFKLVGTGSDAQTNSALTYTWEQNDPAPSTNFTGASSVASPTKLSGPNFRSLPPTTVPERYFPALNTVLSNNLSTTYESVSSIARNLNFTLTARDHGANGGQTNTDAMVVTVNANVGPFDVTSQATQNIAWTQGATETITWAVNNTTSLAGSANVDILLSTDGGLTYPIILKANTPNDGSEAITVPNVAAPFCRVMVKPTGNIYYDVNPVPFAIGYVVTVTTTCVPFTVNPNTTITYNTANPAQWFVVGQVNVPNNFVISDLNLAINLSHSKINDLRIGLVKPGSVNIDRIMYDQTCPGLANVPNSIITTFDDNGANFSCGGVAGSNTYKPLNSFDVFNGLNSAGLWRIAISDVVPANNGTFNSFTLELCSSTTTIVLSNEDFSLTNFSIYPNPNNGNFTVQFDSKSSNEIKIGVHDLRGRQIFNKSYQNSGVFNQNLELNNVQSGVYLVTVQDGDRKEVKKIVIQ